MSKVEDDEQDLTRKQRREQARAQRKALEESERVAARRRRRLIQVGATLTAVAVAAVVAIIASSSGGKKHGVAVAGAGVSAGLQSTAAPWAPEYTGLKTRLESLHLPGESNSAYHVHADLRVYVNGRQTPVPANIGIDTAEEFLAPLHTHDTSGIIHMEASEPYQFTLGQFFTIWGVTFTNTQLGGYLAGNGNVLSVYVNGSPVSNRVAYVMRPHDDIVVGYGKPGSFPTSFQYPWAANPGI
jgi:hypothetical protein